MKFPRKYFNIQKYSQRRSHESVLYHNASSCWSSTRRKKAGLLFVPGKPLALEPYTPAAAAIKDLLKRANRPLQFYNVSPDSGQNHFPRLALALIDDLARLDQLGVHSLQSLPAKYKTSIIDGGMERFTFATASVGDRPVPAEPQAFFQEGELSRLPDREDIYWGGEEEHFQYHAVDPQIRSDLAPNQDPDQVFCKDDVPGAWIEADEEECADGAKPRVYGRLDIPNDIAAEIYSDSHDDYPIHETSSLAPHLFIMQISCFDHTDAAEADDNFASMYRRYVYLTSHRDCKRVHAFRQEDPAFPRWLLVQEFRSLDSIPIHSRKKGVEDWWRRNGWEGVLVEAFSDLNQAKSV